MVGRRDILKRGLGVAGAVAAGSALEPGDLNRKDRQAGQEAPSRNLALLLVDRSGSMASIRDATITGLNQWLDDQRDKPDLLVSLIQFDEPGTGDRAAITETFDFIPATQTPRLTEADFVPRGGTPLYRSIILAISRLERIVRKMDRALLVIQTDGHDTDVGEEVNVSTVKDLIKAKEAEGNWTFAFMGANIDAFEQSGQVGLPAANTFQYSATPVSTLAAYTATSSGTQSWYQSKTPSLQSFYNPPNVAAAAGSLVVEPTKQP